MKKDACRLVPVQSGTLAEIRAETLAGTLEKIVCAKRRDIGQMLADEDTSTPQPSTRSLINALLSPGPQFIFEFKKASPSMGNIKPNADPAQTARLYNRHGAAISVLCEGHHFNGSLDDLRTVRQNTSLPILAKDFFLDPVQIRDARRAGADAILLMLSVLSNNEYTVLAVEAARYNMDIVCEVHNAGEMERAISLNAPIIGVNNRNLGNLAVSLETTVSLVPMVPKDRLIISESGINSRQDVIELSPLVNGFLIGTAIMGARDPAGKIHELCFGKVKLCGMTRAEDVICASENGATYTGLIFAPQSPRVITLDEAKVLTNAAPVNYVGVFKDQSLLNIARYVDALGLSVVQLHGSETVDFRKALHQLIPRNVEIWQAVQVNGQVPNIMPEAADRTVFDTYHPTLSGGTGRCFDWRLLDGLETLGQSVLAGGLNASNAAAAARTGAHILDFNSGLETAAGIKDTRLIEACFHALRHLNTLKQESNHA
jgi:indole-3-glycerol phosphate synthase / phosphoribosylanthranilate isomerase